MHISRHDIGILATDIAFRNENDLLRLENNYILTH